MRASPALIAHTAEVLADALRFRGPADQLVSRYFRERRRLGQQERAFIAETAFAVLRRRRSLAFAAQSEQPYPLVLAALVYLHGMSVRAIAELVPSNNLPLIERIRAAKLGDQPAAVRLDLPDWLWARLAARYGETEGEAIAQSLLETAPIDLRANLVKATREAILATLRAAGIACGPTRYSPWGIRLAGKPAINRHPLYLDGTLEVQDEGSQLLAALVAPRRGEMVVDFCAGAGGKTLALGALMRSTGRLYALDVSAKRLAKLGPRLARSGLSNVHPVVIATENDLRAKRLTGKIDRVLVDAPCSGFGTLRRNPDLKWRYGEAGIAKLVTQQSRILEAAARLLRPGGRLVYATCSVLREEGEGVAEQFLAAHPEFTPLDCAGILAGQHIALDTGNYLRLFPHRHQTDGFFAAAYERKA